ncbi:MAG: phage integrase N-terminal SAM-like domain-containing protein [Anaerolineae bacterium]
MTQPRKKKLPDRVREAIRRKHYSIRTEEAYVSWIKRYVLFHNRRHPLEMGRAEIRAFLAPLAVEMHVAASTQTQALSALLFLYRAIRARKPKRYPLHRTSSNVSGAS